ncbi:uncharacterized protein LOC111788313 [Cucurbita pepo subsp. pepo]|uniref:uncharacterized protein LOC111788313 n=1 Tax=Cucurbita pepo subsp. pepo TaxID=3664 RepID=UPI000C9D45A5|nr:uncharacterized protein LOC111788313 [Cucurbita pepo subsp. pepo]
MMELLRSSCSGISAMATSESKPDDRSISLPESESQLSVLVYDISQQAQGAMENMLRMISEIDRTLLEYLKTWKSAGVLLSRVLEEEKQQFQQAAYTVLDMLNNGGGTLYLYKYIIGHQEKLRIATSFSGWGYLPDILLLHGEGKKFFYQLNDEIFRDPLE